MLQQHDPNYCEPLTVPYPHDRLPPDFSWGEGGLYTGYMRDRPHHWWGLLFLLFSNINVGFFTLSLPTDMKGWRSQRLRLSVTSQWRDHLRYLRQNRKRFIVYYWVTDVLGRITKLIRTRSSSLLTSPACSAEIWSTLMLSNNNLIS